MKLALFSALLLCVLAVGSCEIQDIVHNTTIWTDLLQRYVHPNQTLQGVNLHVVDYVNLANDSNFYTFIDQFQYVNLTSLDFNEFYSFLINAYNALAMKMIIDHACIKDLFGNCTTLKSIEDIGTLIPYKPVWDFDAGNIGGVVYSLDDIETLLRRPGTYHFDEDSRLHAAIVCASISCPNVRTEAYNPEDLQFQLSDNFNDFMRNPKKGMLVDQSKNTVYLSSIFSWFRTDFTESVNLPSNLTNRNQIDFILLYLEPSYPQYQWLVQNAHSAVIEFFSYNWDVNGVNGEVPCSVKKRPCFSLFALIVTLACFAIFTILVAVIYTVRKRHRRRHHHSGYNPIQS